METDPSLRLRVTPAGSCKRDHPVMLSVAKPLDDGDRPFAAAQGDTVRHLRLMRIGRDKSGPYGYDECLALVLRTLREEGAINRAPTDTKGSEEYRVGFLLLLLSW
jgi:hypothetical protein